METKFWLVEYDMGGDEGECLQSDHFVSEQAAKNAVVEMRAAGWWAGEPYEVTL
jgi:hypothetical protein